MTKKEDSELVAKSRRGDQAAFGNLVEKYVSLAGAVAFSVVGDYHTAGDVVQEAFIKVHRALDSLDDPGKFKSWLYGIVRTTALDFLRKNRVKIVSIDSISEKGREIEAHRKGEPWEDVEGDETKQKVLEAVGSLPERYRIVVLLKHFENMSYREIARTVDATESAVESRLFRARQLLKKKLKGLK